MPATQGMLAPFLNALEAVVHLGTPRIPSQGPLESVFNTAVFAAHTQGIPTLRTLHRLLGRRMRVFGGETFTSFKEVSELMARESEKIDWFSGPLADRADYLTKGYVPFLLEGPNHELRRKHILGKVARAHANLAELDPLLDAGPDAEHAIARFLFQQFCSLELDDDELRWFLEFKRRAEPLVLMPKLLRMTVLRELHESLQTTRRYFMERIESTGEPIADSWFDVIWFNAGTLSFYPEKALETIRAEPAMRPLIQDEAFLSPEQRPKTRALIHEMLRIHGKIASTNYVEQGKVRIALMTTAVVDPERYQDPLRVDLDRDHSDTLAFAGPSPSRKCPADRFAPDLMAAVVAHAIRQGDRASHH